VVPRRCGCGAGRRGVLTGLGASALGLAVPGRAPAEVPASLDELFDTFYGLNQPEAVRFPRRRLEKVFSVLLMRSGYASLDALDFFPVDRFQVQFWKLRASQQEAYNNLYDPLKMTVGDLADPCTLTSSASASGRRSTGASGTLRQSSTSPARRAGGTRS